MRSSRSPAGSDANPPASDATHSPAGDYATKGLYAFRGGKYEGLAFFGTGGGEEAMDASPSHEQVAAPREAELRLHRHLH